MIEPRVYRAAFLPALLAVVLTMFSFQSRPGALPQGLAADVLFDGELAAQQAARLAERRPDRRPGTLGNRQTADQIATTFDRRGFTVERDRFSRDGKDLENVIARRPGSSRRQIVVLAARDASVVPDAPGSASDTAALLELARVFEGRPARKTLVLASVDGSTLGEVGSARLADQIGEPELVDGVIEVSDLGSNRRGESPIVPWSNDARRGGLGLHRTVADSIREELDDRSGGSAGAAGQLARLAFPIGIGSQGLMLERGYDAIRISGSGELPPAGNGPVEDIDEDSLGGLGRAALRTLTALDNTARPPEHGPRSYVTAVSQVVPGWVLALLAIAFVLPAIVASVDAFARARRRRLPVLPWLRYIGAAVVPFLVVLALGELLALVGAMPEPPPSAVAPKDFPLDGGALGVLGGLLVALVLAFFAARLLLVKGNMTLADKAAPGAGCAVALTASVTALVAWIVNSYAALLLVPAVHLWMLATLVDPAPRRATRVALVLAGLLPAALVALYYAFALSLDPVEGAWYLLLLVTGHSVGFATSLLGCVLLGTLVATLSIARRPDPPAVQESTRPAVYGPGSYAGPGSLGGTRSALRR